MQGAAGAAGRIRTGRSGPGSGVRDGEQGTGCAVCVYSGRIGIVFVSLKPNSTSRQLDDLRCRDPLHAGRARCPSCFAALNFGLQAKRNSFTRQTTPLHAFQVSVCRPSACSGSEPAFIFRIRRVRCTFTVTSARPTSAAICLQRRPCVTWSMISRCRGDSPSKRSLSVAKLPSLSRRA
jgi:hypothetical protein